MTKTIETQRFTSELFDVHFLGNGAAPQLAVAEYDEHRETEPTHGARIRGSARLHRVRAATCTNSDTDDVLRCREEPVRRLVVVARRRRPRAVPLRLLRV